MRRLPLLLMLSLGACTFGGGGLLPSAPAPPAYVTDEDLDVPYVATPRPVVEAMLDMAEVGPGDYLIDLGSGDGRIAIRAAQRGARALGVDIDPDRIAEATAAARLSQVETRALFRRQDLFATPLGEANVITMYLLPEVNMRLRPRLLTEARPGTRIVSHNFTLGDWRPDLHRQVGASNVYLWIVPAPVGGRWSVSLEDGTSWPLEIEQRFQEVTGALGGSALRDAVLRGRSLRFTVDLPGGSRTFRGVAGDSEIVPDPSDSGGTRWRAARIG